VKREKQDRYGMEEAEVSARQSKDPSTNVGACILRPDGTVASKGWNGFPRKIEDKPELLADREAKNRRTIHAEMNAILTAREPLHGYTLYCTHISCERCAVHIIQAGIERVVFKKPSEEFMERWGASIDLAVELYREAGVSVTLL
jgi:dCMP deaminase